MTTLTDRLNAALADRYRIERELGAGGMATVYLAHDVKHDRRVALKVLKPELAAVLGADRFVVEIKTTASLQHPHILPLFDSGTADGFLYYVMPFIQGETLRDKLNRETQLGVDEAVRIARDVADALDYAHRHGVIHRDIKPENILLHDGRPVVADFGIALAVSAAAGGRMTETGLSLGTPHYMSPEQATADKEISARSDIYSLGSVLYEMLAGNPPHTGSSAQQIIMKIIAEPVEAVTRYRKTVPAHVAAAVAKALEKLPADRFETAKAFGDALGNPSFTTATSADAIVGAGAAQGIPPLVFWVTAGMAVLSLAVAGWSLTRPLPAAAVTRVGVVLPDSQRLAEGTSYRVAVSPDGRTIAYVGQGASATGTRLWVRRLDELRATPLAGTDGAMNPSFSPDGKHIAFVSAAPRAVRVIPIGGGPSTAVADSLVDLGGVSWGSDGYIYYDAHFTGDGLARVRESGGKPEVASIPDTVAGERYHMSPSVLPDGRGVLFTIARVGTIAAYDVGVLDTKTGKHRVLVHGVFARYAASGHLVFVTADGLMMAAPFDLTRLQITGDPVPVAEGVAVRVLARGDVAISRNGLLVYAAGSGIGVLQELVWVGHDGKATEVDPQFKRPFSSRVRLSPDGRQAAVTQSEGAVRSVWVKQLDRGPAARVVEGGSPTWSPDGKLLLFLGPIDLRTMPADGSRLPTVFSVGGTSAPTLPEFTPDGKWMLYTVSGDIYGMATNGDTTRRPFIASRAFERMQVVSPDGRWIAYTSDESGTYQVFVRPFPDVSISKRQVSVSGGIAPRWSRNGRELFFVDETLSMVSVPITPGATFVAGEPKRLFDASIYDVPNRPFDVAADGRFLMIRPVGAVAPKADELILVENFFEELKARVKPK